MAVSTDYINTGGGKLYIQKYENGSLVGAKTYFGITENVNLTTTTEFLEHKNTESAITKTDKKIQKSVSAQITFSTAEVSIPMLARAYAGKITVKSQTAQVDTPVTVTGVVKGGVYSTGSLNVTTLVVKSDDDATTYAEGVDYTLDKGAGEFEILENSTIADASDIKLTVSADAFEGSIMAGLKASQLEARLIFVSAPLAGKRFKYTFKKVAISASGDFSLKSEDFAIIAFEGTALSDETVTNPILSDYFDIEEIAV